MRINIKNQILIIYKIQTQIRKMEDITKPKNSNFLSQAIHSLMRFQTVRELIYKYFLYRPPKYNSN